MFVSVDLGNSRIMMMAAERQDDGTLKVLALETEETPAECIQHGIVKKPAELASLLSSMAKKMENRLENLLGKKYDVNSFYTAVNGRSLRSLRGHVSRSFSTSTEITFGELSILRNDLRDKINTERAIYSITNEEYLVDGEYVRDPNGIVCREIGANYLIVLGRSDIRDNLQKCIDRVQLADVNIDGLAPLAMSDAVLSAEDKSEGVVHINFGAGTTSVVVYQNGYLRHVAVVPFGGKHITNDLANEACGLNLSLTEAELFKMKYGSPIASPDGKDLRIKIPSKPGSEPRIVLKSEMTKVINARLAEIVTLCTDEIERSGYAEQLRAGVVVTGGASRIADFKEFLEQKIGMSVRLGVFAHHLDIESVEKYSNTEYTLLVGLLLNATDECVRERKIEEDKPIAPKKEKKSSSWKNIFNNVGTLFDEPEGPTIK
ncbi:MAG: cell division protein FtsA [Paludibacteraceae bacterium]|nr:cell division protein FtsA [Paludibacteraceae bacterium]